MSSITTNKKPVRICVAPGCVAAVPPSHRKYCVTHSEQAVALWKKSARERADRAYRRAKANDPATPMPYLHGFACRDAYRAYYRDAMQRSRERRSGAAARIVTVGRLSRQVTR